MFFFFFFYTYVIVRTTTEDRKAGGLKIEKLYTEDRKRSKIRRLATWDPFMGQ